MVPLSHDADPARFELTIRVGAGGVSALNNASSDAQSAKTGGWLDAVSYQAGLSGGSWATGTTVINNYTLPTDLIKNVSRYSVSWPRTGLCYELLRKHIGDRTGRRGS